MGRPRSPSMPDRVVDIGRRIHVIGNSGSGKSTLAAAIAEEIGAPLVELDALNFLPNWVGLNEHDPAEFERRITEATAGDAWVVAGSYSAFAKRVFWPRLETVIWLDLPMATLIRRVLLRSWNRWRSGERLWGTNYESIWRTLAFWKRDSLLHWIVTQHRRKRRDMWATIEDPRWRHIRFVRIGSELEARAFMTQLRPHLRTTHTSPS